MKYPSITLACFAACTLSSCAYMQLHKNVEQYGDYYEGFEADKPEVVYESQGKWYVKGKKYHLRYDYPLIYDTVFLEGGKPQLVHAGPSLGDAYLEISHGTSIALRERSGYATLPILQRELQEIGSAPIDSLAKNAIEYKVKAEIPTAQHPIRVTHADIHSKKSSLTTTLSYATLVFVDVPGTLAYNIAIPVMAPFYFFADTYDDFTKGHFE